MTVQVIIPGRDATQQFQDHQHYKTAVKLNGCSHQVHSLPVYACLTSTLAVGIHQLGGICNCPLRAGKTVDESRPISCAYGCGKIPLSIRGGVEERNISNTVYLKVPLIKGGCDEIKSKK